MMIKPRNRSYILDLIEDHVSRDRQNRHAGPNFQQGQTYHLSALHLLNGRVYVWNRISKSLCPNHRANPSMNK